MPVPLEGAATVSADAFRALLTMAGLTISEEREPLVLADLNAQLAFARQLDTVLDGTQEPNFGPYDPTFPEIVPEDETV